ncbi:unnamed protein product, partial [Brachionus calyciflorus]
NEHEAQRFRSMSTRGIGMTTYESQYGSVKSRPVRKASASNVQANMKDFEIIDDEMIETKKPVGRRRASSRQLAESTSNYKSNEVQI